MDSNQVAERPHAQAHVGTCEDRCDLRGLLRSADQAIPADASPCKPGRGEALQQVHSDLAHGIRVGRAIDRARDVLCTGRTA